MDFLWKAFSLTWSDLWKNKLIKQKPKLVVVVKVLVVMFFILFD